jgi:hypothetical protein
MMWWILPQRCIKNMANSVKKEPIQNEVSTLGHNRDATACEFLALRLFSPCFFPFGKAGALQSLCCQGFAVGALQHHPFRRGSEALRLLQHWGLDGKYEAQIRFSLSDEKQKRQDRYRYCLL